MRLNDKRKLVGQIWTHKRHSSFQKQISMTYADIYKYIIHFGIFWYIMHFGIFYYIIQFCIIICDVYPYSEKYIPNFGLLRKTRSH